MSGTRTGAWQGLLRIALIGTAALAGTLLMAGQANAAFPPGTNGKIIYVVNGASSDDIWVMNQDGSGKTNLTPNTDSSDEYNPAFSPDGKKIVFARSQSGDCDIWVMNANGSSPIDLTNNASECEELPTWSPDGKKIAYTNENVGDGSVFVMNADGSGKTNLTPDNDDNWDSQPNYSPDGMKIAWTRCITGSSCQIWAMNADGSGKARVVNDPNTVDNFAPYYSPDGKQLAYVYDTGPEDVAVAPATGGAGSVITGALPGSRNVHPGWSPDGTRIAITAGNGGNSQDIWLINPNGSNPVNLTSDDATQGDTQPDWESIYTCRGKRAGIVGTEGNDVLLGQPTPNVVVAFGGFDQINTGAGSDLICGGDGGSKIISGGRRDIVVGGSGKDKIKGVAGNDLLIGKKGKDKLFGQNGKDKVKGGKGNDKLFGNKRNDVLKAGSGNDFLNGGPGFDKCVGGKGKDVFRNCEKIKQ